MDEGSYFPKPAEAEMRRITPEARYNLEMECRRQGSGDPDAAGGGHLKG